MELILLIDLAITLALLLGYYNRRQMPSFFRIILLQLGLALVTELCGTLLYLMSLRTNPLYNVYIVAEVVLLTLAANKALDSGLWRRISAAGILVFLSAWCYHAARRSLFYFANWAYVAEGILLSTLFLALIFRYLRTPTTPLYRQPFFWFCVAQVAYFCGVIPYFCLMHYLEQHKPRPWMLLYDIINSYTNLIRYLIIIVSFLMLQFRKTSFITFSNGR